MLTPLDFSQDTIPTASEASEDSFCSGEHNVQTVENNQDNFDGSVELSVLSSEGIYDNVEDGLKNFESSPVLDALNFDSSDNSSSDIFDQMDEQVAQSAEVLDRTHNMMFVQGHGGLWHYSTEKAATFSISISGLIFRIF